jgi:hypothetical protein
MEQGGQESQGPISSRRYVVLAFYSILLLYNLIRRSVRRLFEYFYCTKLCTNSARITWPNESVHKGAWNRSALRCEMQSADTENCADVSTPDQSGTETLRSTFDFGSPRMTRTGTQATETTMYGCGPVNERVKAWVLYIITRVHVETSANYKAENLLRHSYTVLYAGCVPCITM